MAWIKHIDLVINEAFAKEAPPAHPEMMAEVLRQLGHPDVAGYVARMDEVSYDDLKWSIELRQMNAEDMQVEEPLTDVELEQMYQRDQASRDNGYANYDYEEAYNCK